MIIKESIVKDKNNEVSKYRFNVKNNTEFTSLNYIVDTIMLMGFVIMFAVGILLLQGNNLGSIINELK